MIGGPIPSATAAAVPEAPVGGACTRDAHDHLHPGGRERHRNKRPQVSAQSTKVRTQNVLAEVPARTRPRSTSSVRLDPHRCRHPADATKTGDVVELDEPSRTRTAPTSVDNPRQCWPDPSYVVDATGIALRAVGAAVRRSRAYRQTITSRCRRRLGTSGPSPLRPVRPPACRSRDRLARRVGCDESLRTSCGPLRQTIKAAVIHTPPAATTTPAAQSASIVRASYATTLQGNGWCESATTSSSTVRDDLRGPLRRHREAPSHGGTQGRGTPHHGLLVHEDTDTCSRPTPSHGVAVALLAWKLAATTATRGQTTLVGATQPVIFGPAP